MPKKIYRLKPHHIEFLYGFVLKGEEGIRKDINSPYPEPFTYPDIPEEKYSPEFAESLIKFCNEFINNKEALLKVKNGGIDDICLLGKGCNKRKPACEGKENYESVKKINVLFGLRPSKKKCYRVSDVVEKMQKLKNYLLNVES